MVRDDGSILSDSSKGKSASPDPRQRVSVSPSPENIGSASPDPCRVGPSDTTPVVWVPSRPASGRRFRFARPLGGNIPPSEGIFCLARPHVGSGEILGRTVRPSTDQTWQQGHQPMPLLPIGARTCCDVTSYHGTPCSSTDIIALGSPVLPTLVWPPSTQLLALPVDHAASTSGMGHLIGSPCTTWPHPRTRPGGPTQEGEGRCCSLEIGQSTLFFVFLFLLFLFDFSLSPSTTIPWSM